MKITIANDVEHPPRAHPSPTGCSAARVLGLAGHPVGRLVESCAGLSRAVAVAHQRISSQRGAAEGAVLSTASCKKPPIGPTPLGCRTYELPGCSSLANASFFSTRKQAQRYSNAIIAGLSLDRICEPGCFTCPSGLRNHTQSLARSFFDSSCGVVDDGRTAWRFRFSMLGDAEQDARPGAPSNERPWPSNGPERHTSSTFAAHLHPPRTCFPLDTHASI